MRVDELRKIEKATSTCFKGATRGAVAEELSKTKNLIEKPRLVPEDQRDRRRRLRELRQLLFDPNRD